MARLWMTAAGCALLAGGAAAQEAGDAATLPVLSIEAEGGNAGFFGETFAQGAGSATKTDTPILETPRSVSVVTQQQIQERGARDLAQALQYTPGVFAGFGGNDNRGDWTEGARLRADDLPRRDAVLLRLLQQRPAGALPARHRSRC